MNLRAIRDSLRVQPFRPFSIRLADGRSLPVPHPDFLLFRDRVISFIHAVEGSVILVEPLLIVSLDFPPRERVV